jgi:hypothetical protein
MTAYPSASSNDHLVHVGRKLQIRLDDAREHTEGKKSPWVQLEIDIVTLLLQ